MRSFQHQFPNLKYTFQKEMNKEQPKLDGFFKWSPMEASGLTVIHPGQAEQQRARWWGHPQLSEPGHGLSGLLCSSSECLHCICKRNRDVLKDVNTGPEGLVLPWHGVQSGSLLAPPSLACPQEATITPPLKGGSTLKAFEGLWFQMFSC